MEGQVFRIKTTKADGSPEEDPTQWTKTVFFNPNSASGDHQHINTALSIAKDNDGRIWLYFGTGRFWSALDRQSPYFSYQNSFYGIKEPVVDYAHDNLTLTYGTVAAKATSLKNVTGIEIDNEDQSTFSTLEADIKDNYSGWYLNFSETGERNLGQAALLGEILTFSTYVPNNDLCASEGNSYLYDVYYKTGTAFWKAVLKTDEYPSGIDNITTDGDAADNKVVYKIDIGKGYSTTPNLHTGGKGSKAFLQTSTGAIIGVKDKRPGPSSKGIYWREVLQ